MTGVATTRWSLILDARTGPEAGRVALEQICRDYRYPVLSYVKRHGYPPADAEDLTQDFFARLLEQGWHARADPSRGRFRSYLLSALRHFLSDARDSASAQKRGGGQLHVSTDEDFAALAAPGSESPERTFTRHWMKTVLDRATTRLEKEAKSAGKAELYKQLNGFLGEKPDPSVYKALGETLGMRPNTIAVGVHRMRLRLRELVREVLLQTVADPASLDEEMRELRATFADGFNGD
jgi:RNA polymerase sigma-70 factor (ECF subfamily)